MNKLWKKVLSLLLLLALLIELFPSIGTLEAQAAQPTQPADSSYSTAEKKYEYKFNGVGENKGELYFLDSTYQAVKSTFPLKDGEPYPRIILVKGVPYTLNYNMWKQKNLYVYGCPQNIPSSANQYFKCGYQIQNLNITQPYKYYDTPTNHNNGYFKFPSGVTCRGIEHNSDDDHMPHPATCSTRGEWKFLGYDVNGNYHTNMWMINTVPATSFTSKKWQEDPWNPANKPQTKLLGMSEYNLTAYGLGQDPNSTTIQKTKEWIASTLKGMNALKDSHGDFRGIPTSKTSFDPYNVYKYLYIQSAPSLKMGGSGKMWYNRGTPTDPDLRYQTFSIPKLPDKKEEGHHPVTATIAGKTIEEILEDTKFDTNPADVFLDLSATLNDTEAIKDGASKVVYYTRSDIKEWTFSIEIPKLGYTEANPIIVKQKPQSLAKNMTKAKTKVTTTIGKIRDIGKATSGVHAGKYVFKAYVKAVPTYLNDKPGSTSPPSNCEIIVGEKLEPISIDPEPDPIEPVVIDIPQINIDNHIGEIAFDGVEFDDVSDGTDLSSVISTKVYIDGNQVDYNEFFSKTHIFAPTTDKNGYFVNVTCKYTLDKDKINITGLPQEDIDKIKDAVLLEYISSDWVYVYPTKPNAHYSLTSSSWKENRIINVANDSPNSNIKLVVDRFPIVEYRWTYGGDTANLNKGTDTDLQKQLQYKKKGTYSLTLECRNTLGKWSDPYDVEFEVLEDYAPNIEVNLSDSVVTRTDELTAWHYDLNSTDGDKVAIAKIELWYDSDNNGTLETKLNTWNGLGDNSICEIDDFPKYTASVLGNYKYKLFAKDEFIGVSGQDTLSQFVTDVDKKENTYEVEFRVDNYQPLADLYIETEINRPNVDLFIMGDKNLTEPSLVYLADNRVNMENWLLGRNILPSVNVWNMKTYEYSTPASTSKNTGTSFPDASVPYESAGYSGTLNRTSYADNGGEQDFGTWEKKKESKPFTASETDTIYWDGATNTTTHSNDCPSSVPINSDGYSGSIPKTGATQLSYTTTKNDKNQITSSTTVWQANYSGTLEKEVKYWVPNMQWVSNYTGYYSGTIYKYVRQPYTDPWRANSNKYIMYLSDGNIAELADFNMAVSKADAKIILAGTSAIQAQSAHCDKYIDTTSKTTQQVIDEALEYISQETPSIEYLYVLPNQTFTLKYGEQDLDKDTIITREMQYVHNKDYFDNPTGQETGTQTAFSDTIGWNTTIRSSFANVGKYQLFRRVKDKPIGVYGDVLSYYSGATEVDVYVHRKPIALASLDWDFDAGTNTYKTKWIDKSYDLDHNISRANTDKGILERKLMWRRNDEEWNYTVPDNLSPGTYKLRYYVKDMENTWSDVFTINIDGNLHSNVTQVEFTLATSPPMQFEAKLRSEKLKFRTPETPVTLPASENLDLYEIWTRYPSNPILTMALFKENGTQISPTKTVNFNYDTGKKLINDIHWYNIPFNISEKIADGNYIFKITANSHQSKTISFPVTLTTPINLKGYINGTAKDAQVNTGDVNIFTFTTSSYVNTTQLSFEESTFYSDYNQIKLISDDGINKTWTYTLDLADGAYPDGKLGFAEFKATLPSGRSEIIYVNYKIVGIRATNFLITMMFDIGWRAYYFDVKNGIDDNHDGIKDRFPRHSNTDIGTLKLPINYFSLVGYDRSYIKAGYKVKGRIDIQGEPDSAYFKVNYSIGGTTRSENVSLNKSSGNTYLFEWIIPIDTDNKTFVSFDLVTKKGDSTYGNEKWVDKWDSRNLDQKVLYVKGDALEDLTFVQSH